MRGVAARLLRPSLDTSEIGNDLPDFFVRHPHPLAGSSVRRHSSARNSLVNSAEQVEVGISVSLLTTCQVGSTSTSTRDKPVAKRTVNAKLKFTSLGRLGIASKWIVILRAERCAREHQHKNCNPSRSGISRQQRRWSSQNSLPLVTTPHS